MVPDLVFAVRIHVPERQAERTLHSREDGERMIDVGGMLHKQIQLRFPLSDGKTDVTVKIYGQIGLTSGMTLHGRVDHRRERFLGCDLVQHIHTSLFTVVLQRFRTQRDLKVSTTGDTHT